MPVFGDEAYYYIWSLHPQLSYFDHPAMVSWLITLNQFIFSAGSVMGLRFSFILLSLLTALIWLRLLKNQNFSSKQIFYFIVLFNLNPLLGPGSIMATPDAALVFFWSAAFYCFNEILRTKNLGWYVLLGMALGLGFCSKYHIVVFVISGLIYILLNKTWRELRPGGVVLTLTFGLLFSLPVLIWNAQNNWSSFLFQLNHGFGEESFEWSWPLGYLVAQSLIVNPFILYGLFRKSADRLNKVFSLSQLAFFFSSSFKSVVEGNWPLTSHLHSVTHAVSEENDKKNKYAICYWALFYFLITLFFLLPASEKVRTNLVNSSQFEEVYPLVDQYQPLYGPSYQVASLISWKTQKIVPKLRELSRHDFYDSLPESAPQHNTFYVLKYDYNVWPEIYNSYKKTKVRSFDNSRLELYHFTHE